MSNEKAAKTPLETNLHLLEMCYHEPDLERARDALWQLTWPLPPEFSVQLTKIGKFLNLAQRLDIYSQAIEGRAELFQVLIALSANRPELLANGGKGVVIALIQLCHAKVKRLPQKAQRALAMLENQDAHEAVCKFALDKRYPVALEVAIKENFYPPDLHKRALFFFLTRQWKKYEKLDFDARLMRVVYQNGNQELRRQITETGRTAGRPEILRIVNAEKWNNLTAQEWQVVIRTLIDGKRWEEAWQMVQVAPAEHAVMLLQTLVEKKWQPQQPDQQNAFVNLSRQARQLKTPPPFGGGLKLLTSFEPTGRKPKMHQFFITPGKHLLEMSIVAWDETTRLPQPQFVIWDLHRHKLTQEISGAAWTGVSGTHDSLMKSPTSLTFLEHGVAGLVTPNLIQASSKKAGIELCQISHKYQKPYAVAIAENGTRLVTGHYRIIAVWDLAKKNLIKAYEAHSSYVFQLILDETNQTLTSVDTSGQIKVWRSLLNELAQTALEKISEVELKSIQKLAEAEKFYADDAVWLDFIRDLYTHRFRYDIEVSEMNQVEAADFDIELEE